MKHRLLLKLCFIIGVGTVLLFWAVDLLVRSAEQQMSFLDQAHQQQLINYGREAERLHREADPSQLADWLASLRRTEQTWVAVVDSRITPLAGSELSQQFVDGFRLGRNVEWKIHLYFPDNPIMEVPFADGHTHFLIRLPQRMRPGLYLPVTQLALQLALPFLLLCVLSFVLYRHMMSPLRQLQQATHRFSEGQLDVRVRNCLGSRRDELTDLAETFDQMAERTGNLIISQRQMLADLSHELRTPLARLDMAVDYVEQGLQPQHALERLRYESATMRALVEDALTLAWLDTESPQLQSDDFDLVELLQVICDDARFEHPGRQLHTELPEQAWLRASSQRALGQAFENIIRNALDHTPASGVVTVTLRPLPGQYCVQIRDQGPGVPSHSLRDIFRPFFRLDRSRRSSPVINGLATVSGRQGSTLALAAGETPELGEKAGSAPGLTLETAKRRGFGLGLALAQRQIVAVGGQVWAQNCPGADGTGVSGLEICVRLPQRLAPVEK